MEKYKDEFTYDNNMWTEKHAKEISSAIKSARPLIYLIIILCVSTPLWIIICILNSLM